MVKALHVMIMNKIKWIFFDLDGTLVDNLPSLYSAYLNFLNDYRIKGNKKEFERLNGPSLKEIILILKNKYNLKESNKKLLENYQQKILLAYKKTRPIKYSTKLLKMLNNNNFKLALVTSSSRNLAKIIIKKYKWKKFFKCYVFGNEVSHSKPHPEIYKLCLKRAKTTTTHTLVIEDSKNGYKSATKAGLRCILINKKVKLYHMGEILKKYD